MSISRSIALAVATFLVLPSLAAPLQVQSASAGSFSIAVSDGRKAINPGGTLIYAVTLNLTGDDQETTDVHLTLPEYTTIIIPNQGGELRGGEVVWTNVTMNPDTTLTLNVQVTLLPDVPDGTVLKATATADGVSSTDSTTVGTSEIPQNDIKVSITDNRSTVTPTEEVTYTGTVKNTGSDELTLDVHMSVGQFVMIDDIDPMPYRNEQSLTWYQVTLDPGSSETFTLRGTIDRGAAEYFLITTKLQAGGVTATDLTSVQTNPEDLMNGDDDDEDEDSTVRFSVAPSTQEVLPGGRIIYTVSVKNTGAEKVSDLTATVKLDPSLMILVDAGTAERINSSTLEWSVPDLQSGETWKATFAVTIASELAAGTTIPILATLQGPTIESISLQSRIAVTSVGVISELPATGVPLDVLATFLLIPISAAAAGAQRRLKRA